MHLALIIFHAKVAWFKTTMSQVQYFSNCFNFREYQKSMCFVILIDMTSFAFDVYSYYRNQIIYGVVLSSRPFLSPSETWKLLRRISDRRGYLNRFKQHVNVKGIYEVSQFSSVFCIWLSLSISTAVSVAYSLEFFWRNRSNVFISITWLLMWTVLWPLSGPLKFICIIQEINIQKYYWFFFLNDYVVWMDSVGIYNRSCLLLTQTVFWHWNFLVSLIWYGLRTFINNLNFYISFKIIFCPFSEDSKLAAFPIQLQIFMVP